jgi:hypothetical protein
MEQVLNYLYLIFVTGWKETLQGLKGYMHRVIGIFTLGLLLNVSSARSLQVCKLFVLSPTVADSSL